MKKLILLLVPFLIGWNTQPATAQQKKQIQFEDILNGTFRPEGIRQVNWMKNGRYYTALERTQSDIELRKYDITTGEYKVITSTSELDVEGRSKPIIIRGYEFSPDESKILVKTDVERIWRRSTRENYFVYNRETGEVRKLIRSEDKQQYATFSPTGDKVAYVQNNDLYIVDLSTRNITAVTTDGEKGKIINGATDWVYEEEFGFDKAFYWSPDGSKIAFYRFNEERVNEFFYTQWGSLYPGQVRYKYPKAGEQNSIVKIAVYDLSSNETTWMDIGDKKNIYIPRIEWTQSSNVLAISRMNRLQTKREILLANATTGESHIIKTQKAEAWIDVSNDMTFLGGGSRFIYASEESGYNHIYLYDMEGNLIRQVTKGNWEVTNYLGFNEENNRIYYISTEESPLERHLYSIKISGEGKKKLTDKPGWYSINMSPDFQYYIQTWSAPGEPPVYTLHSAEGDKIRVLEDNSELRKTLTNYKMPTKTFMKIPLPQATLNAYMLKPADFDSTKKYPVLVYVYGGPGSQTVTKRFASGQRAMWHRFLTTKDIIIFSVDNRGTGGRGRDFEKQVYKKLGQYEIEDQIDAIQYLAENFSFVDSTRTGIWGWSYGGYMAALGISKGHEVFETAISVSPVTSWRFYDTIYTERFMQTPQMNPEGYRKGSPLTYADLVEGEYLLVHGTGDDNVHFQNTIHWINALLRNGVQFELMIYPNRNHGIYGGNTRHHLWRLLTDFVVENL